MTPEEKFSLLLWDFQELEIAFEKATGGKWIRKSNTPQHQWVGLTVEEIKETYFTTRADFVDYARAIEAKLKEKNA